MPSKEKPQIEQALESSLTEEDLIHDKNPDYTVRSFSAGELHTKSNRVP